MSVRMCCLLTAPTAPPPPADLSLICYSNCPWYCSLPLKGKADLPGRGHLRAEPSAAVQEEVPDINTLDALVPATYAAASLSTIVIPWIFPFGLQKAKLLFFPSPNWLPFFSSLPFYV